MHIKKGDNVQIIAGKDKGKQGKVQLVDIKNDRILVQGLNMFKKHQRPKKQGEKGSIVSIARPLHVSNAMIVCQSCKKPARIKMVLKDGGVKVRQCKKCSATI
ncbi:MAG: 50S ribosomal protein L24 [bacterium]|nr:50S ribosomal protein L24 [bacterium]